MTPSRILRCHKPAMTLLLLVVVGGFSVAMAQNAGENKGAKEKTKEKAESKEAAAGAKANGNKGSSATATAPPAPTQGLLAFGKMLPVGQAHKELEIPSFKNGAPASMVQAMVMTRTDEENMFLEEMDIWMYGPPGEAEKDMRVQLRTATFHMPSSIIASDEPSRISRSDFDLQGDTLVFDTATGQGKMVGNVRMILHDASSFSKTPEEDSADSKKEKEDAASGKEGAPDAPTPASKSPTAGSSTPAANARPASTATRGRPGAGSGAASPTNPKK